MTNNSNEVTVDFLGHKFERQALGGQWLRYFHVPGWKNTLEELLS
jgi:hypothetical protein